MGYQTVPPVPAGLAKYPRAIERWNTLWLDLEPTRIKPGLHGDLALQYCVRYSDMRDAMEKMERGKLIAEQKRTTGTGADARVVVEKLGISPFQSVFDAAIRDMDRIGKMLGLDPMNPLEETRTLSDYMPFTIDSNPDDAWEETEGEDDGNDATGDAGQSDAGSDGDAAATEPGNGNDADAGNDGSDGPAGESSGA